MSGTPRVTLGVTTYNNERYLDGAFRAVLAQDFPDFEVVVCDNQSTDATWEICQRYAEKDSRFRIYRNEQNLGQSRNFARVVSLARGEYFRQTAHDDLFAPTLLSRCVAALDANPRAVLAYPQGTVIDAEGNELFPCEHEPDIHASSSIRRVVMSMQALTYCNSIFGLIRTDVLRRTRLLAPLCANDNPLLVELAARGEFHLIPERLFFRRANDEIILGNSSGIRERYKWLDPQMAAGGTRWVRSGNELPQITIETVKALAYNEMSLGVRIGTTVAYCVAWPTRLARIQLGKWRSRLDPHRQLRRRADRVAR
jgi:glycosyltransferase involved in cell wall biosynthesis